MTATAVTEKKTCNYWHPTWHCHFQVEPGEDLCIFHLQNKNDKGVVDFWQHLAWYLSALYTQAQDKKVISYWQSARAPDWLQKCGAAPQDVHARYLELARREHCWRFAGFVFPAMDGQHSLAGMVLPFCDFHEATFDGDASFSGVHFLAEAVFDETRFHGEADFVGAKFHSLAYFVQAAFGAKALFRRAEFSSAAAEFLLAKFGAEADFQSATFSTGAIFEDSQFDGLALFSRAEFGGKANFERATLSSTADFSRAHFGDILSFERGRLNGETTSFQDAEFSGQVWFRRTELDTLLVVKYAHLRNQMLFDGTRMQGRTQVLLWGLNFVHGMSDLTMEERELRSQQTSNAVTMTKQASWRGSLVGPAGQVVFRDIVENMNRVSFLHTDILTDRLLVRFSNVKWQTGPKRFIFDAKFAFVKHREWGRKKLMEETGLSGSAVNNLPELFFADRPPPERGTPAQETDWKAQQLRDCEPFVKQDVERVAREIRLFHEKYGNYPDAGNYYVAEMDFRRARLPRRAWLKRPAMWLYWLVSRYGESPARALTSVLAAVFGFGFAFVIAGFKFMGTPVNRDLRFAWSERWATLGDIWLAAQMALANLMPGNLRGDVLGLELTSPATKTWAVLQVIVTYILLTLLLLAIRRRFRR